MVISYISGVCFNTRVQCPTFIALIHYIHAVLLLNTVLYEYCGGKIYQNIWGQNNLKLLCRIQWLLMMYITICVGSDCSEAVSHGVLHIQQILVVVNEWSIFPHAERDGLSQYVIHFTCYLQVSKWIRILKCKPLFCSVTNTAKRALLIWTSILMFHNPVTVPSAVGTGTVIVGVFLYQQALSFESRSSTPMPESPQTTNTYVKPP